MSSFKRPKSKGPGVAHVPLEELRKTLKALQSYHELLYRYEQDDNQEAWDNTVGLCEDTQAKLRAMIISFVTSPLREDAPSTAGSVVSSQERLALRQVWHEVQNLRRHAEDFLGTSEGSSNRLRITIDELCQALSSPSSALESPAEEVSEIKTPVLTEVSSITTDTEYSEPDEESFLRNRILMDEAMNRLRAPETQRSRRMRPREPVDPLFLPPQDIQMGGVDVDDSLDHQGYQSGTGREVEGVEKADDRMGEADDRTDEVGGSDEEEDGDTDIDDPPWKKKWCRQM